MKISCIIKGQNSKIRVYGQTNRLKIPTTIWSHVIWSATGQQPKYKEMCFFRVKKSQGRIMTSGGIPHVGGGGQPMERYGTAICWGRVKRPKNIKEANTRFWASGFHRRNIYNNLWGETDKYFKGEKYLRFVGGCTHIVFSDTKKWLQQAPTNCIVRFNKKRWAILPVEKIGKAWCSLRSKG